MRWGECTQRQSNELVSMDWNKKYKSSFLDGIITDRWGCLWEKKSIFLRMKTLWDVHCGVQGPITLASSVLFHQDFNFLSRHRRWSCQECHFRRWILDFRVSFRSLNRRLNTGIFRELLSFLVVCVFNFP